MAQDFFDGTSVGAGESLMVHLFTFLDLKDFLSMRAVNASLKTLIDESKEVDYIYEMHRKHLKIDVLTRKRGRQRQLFERMDSWDDFLEPEDRKHLGDLEEIQQREFKSNLDNANKRQKNAQLLLLKEIIVNSHERHKQEIAQLNHQITYKSNRILHLRADLTELSDDRNEAIEALEESEEMLRKIKIAFGDYLIKHETFDQHTRIIPLSILRTTLINKFL